ncbi:MAG: rhodanese-like domain-containing protein [Rickettsiaceae bacterium]
MLKEITSLKAYNYFLYNMQDVSARLIDVRTETEWIEYGYPDLKENVSCLLLSLYMSPKFDINIDFDKKLTINIQNKDTYLLFLCKSGQRSALAGQNAVNLGYVNCYNIVDGFSGNQYGMGWKNSNLPIKFMQVK